jgi:hypothetical protein
MLLFVGGGLLESGIRFDLNVFGVRMGSLLLWRVVLYFAGR